VRKLSEWPHAIEYPAFQAKDVPKTKASLQGVPPIYLAVPPIYLVVPPNLSCFAIIAKAEVALLLRLDLLDAIANIGVVDVSYAINLQYMRARSISGL
jgi:hypothetical protein